MMSFENEAANALRELANRVDPVEPGLNTFYELDLASLTDDRKKSVREELVLHLSASNTAIYSISLPDADPALVYQALTSARDDKVDERCYSQVLRLPHHPSMALYVGSSRDLAKRLMEHLGFGPKKTYSLHLRHWATQFGKVRINVRFYPASTDKAVLRALEEHLANKLVPLFGRRGPV
ncbi:GIY-YIG nuclease family protein [Sphingobium aromaticiconvertens]|uniref:GIY-YIG nuclease family protein n=1 Tax=Sphingobium aromaticiconvertens TaxID=365341 RepID=UPI0030179E20